MHLPDGGTGIYHGSVAFGSHTGAVVVTVGTMVMTGEAITTGCSRTTGQNGLTNWNAWVGSAWGAASAASPALDLADQVCVEGTGVGNYAGLCSFACGYVYCPIGSCTCIRMGAQVPLLKKATRPAGAPSATRPRASTSPTAACTASTASTATTRPAPAAPPSTH